MPKNSEHATPDVASLQEDVMLASRFRDPEHRLLFARAYLFPNRIEFSGITLSGVYRKMLLLENVEQVEWRTGQIRAVNLILSLRDGSTYKFWVSTAGLWKYLIDANMRTLSRQLTAGPMALA
ncbi:MAG: hypothetical protein SH809_19295 [Rhodothermales bacterium]|nr:hypothetical protein [Rhodothermales bacterium]